MKILHICAGWQHWNGAANIARMIMGEQEREGHSVSFRTWASIKELRAADEVWIHCGWLLCLWWAALWARNARWMPEACYDPVRLKFSAWKKRLVGPIERWALRRCKKLVATCDAEKEWIEAYLWKRCPEIEVTDVKRFFKLNHKIHEIHEKSSAKLNVLYLGRRHPLKGVEYLEKAVAELNNNSINLVQEDSTRSTCSTRLRIDLRIVSDVLGEELEKVWDWCDVLVLPTLSENFGLVVAEALERGKRVITTDGAPVWGEEESGGACECVREGVVGRLGGKLIYLKGYRDGSDEERVKLLMTAILTVCRDEMI